MAMAIKDQRGEYRAGACNIGPEEIAQRRRVGLVFLAVAVGLAAILLLIDAPVWTRTLIWPPLAAAFGRTERIGDDAARATDRRTAIVMATYCSLAAAGVTALFVLLPT